MKVLKPEGPSRRSLTSEKDECGTTRRSTGGDGPVRVAAAARAAAGAAAGVTGADQRHSSSGGGGVRGGGQRSCKAGGENTTDLSAVQRKQREDPWWRHQRQVSIHVSIVFNQLAASAAASPRGKRSERSRRGGVREPQADHYLCVQMPSVWSAQEGSHMFGCRQCDRGHCPRR